MIRPFVRLGLLAAVCAATGPAARSTPPGPDGGGEGGLIEPTPFVTVEVLGREFRSADDVVVRVTWTNPTAHPVGIGLEHNENHDGDFVWNRVRFAAGQPWYRQSDYGEKLRKRFEGCIVYYTFVIPLAHLPAHSSKHLDMSLTAFLDPASLTAGTHEIGYTAQFHHSRDDDPRLPRGQTHRQRGTIRFTIAPDGKR